MNFVPDGGPFPIDEVRRRFPILERDASFVFFDNAAGAQIPATVLEAVTDHHDGCDGVFVAARTAGRAVCCRSCGVVASRVHSRYRRRLQDLACAGRPVTIELEVRRFFCDNTACELETFAEHDSPPGPAPSISARAPGGIEMISFIPTD